MVKAVLFDLDETLITRSAAIRAFINDQYERHAAALSPLSRQTYCQTFLEVEQNGVINKRLVYPLLVEKLHITGIGADVLLDDYEAVYPNFATLTPGARETVEAIHRAGLKLGIITNGNAIVQQRKIDAIGIRPFLDAVLVSETEELRKPDPEIFRRAAQRLGTDIGGCLFVGDNPEVDIIGGAAAGMRTAFFLSTTPWPENLAVPDQSITQLHQVLAICGIK